VGVQWEVRVWVNKLHGNMRQYIVSGDFGTEEMSWWRFLPVAVRRNRDRKNVECFVSAQRGWFRGIRLGRCGGILGLRNSPAG
jgi:hypothetical protein